MHRCMSLRSRGKRKVVYSIGTMKMRDLADSMFYEKNGNILFQAEIAIII